MERVEERAGGYQKWDLGTGDGIWEVKSGGVTENVPKDSKRMGSEDGNSAISIQFAPEEVIESSEHANLRKVDSSVSGSILIVDVT